jgi:hypothetical protein
MLARPLLGDILGDEGLTRGLGDPEARVLVEWLVEQADTLADRSVAEAAAEVRRLCRRGRAVACFVRLWCYEGSRRSAIQLAAVERFGWPLPTQKGADPCELMQNILTWEGAQLASASAAAASRARAA